LKQFAGLVGYVKFTWGLRKEKGEGSLVVFSGQTQNTGTEHMLLT